MSFTLDDALKRLDGALDLIEAAVARRLDAERRKGDLETELQIMHDDRAGLAVELDAAQARLARVEAAAEDVGSRLKRATQAVRELLAGAEA